MLNRVGIAPWIVQRYTPANLLIDFYGYDFSGGTFKAQVREYPDSPNVLITLQNAAEGSQGISVETRTEDDMTVSQLSIAINESTIESIYPPDPYGVRVGGNVLLYWDLHIEGGGLPKIRWLEGQFIIEAGVTQ